MLLPIVVLDASMTVAEALRRLARNGLWLDPTESEAAAWIRESAALVDAPLDEVAQRLARPVKGVQAAIRRQWYASVLWYVRPVDFLLRQCQAAPSGAPLLVTLGLHEGDSELPIVTPAPGAVPAGEGLVLLGDAPVAVSYHPRMAAVPPSPMREPPTGFPTASVPASPAGNGGSSGWGDIDLGSTRGAQGEEKAAARPERVVQTWPRLDAPEYVPARKPFKLVVGFGREQQPGVAGAQVNLPAPPGADQVQLTVELTADGVDAPDGWSRPMPTPLADPTSASVTFPLIGKDPRGPEPAQLTRLEIRYLLQNGETCGTASKPLVVGPAGVEAPDFPHFAGTQWLKQPTAVSAVDLGPGTEPPDLTIELLKPDGNAARGYFVCRLRSPHPIKANLGPFQVDFGDDAKTFARTIVDRIRLYGSTPLVDNYFRAFGMAVAEKLPQSAYDALREVAAILAPRPPTVLFISAEPYVPWELAHIDPPLDPGRPPYLGAQVLLGRWLRDKPVDDVPPGGTARVENPPVTPPSEIPVKHMAVVAGIYQATSGFRALPEAKVEAEELTRMYDAIPLAASAQAISQLLDARLEHKFQVVGGADTVHFAGHGEFDPSRPDSSVLYLSDGMPLSSDLFRGARYGGTQRPLVFLNACMIGIGGEMLGDMGGFPGNCLKGGFGGVLGALWEVNDVLARKIAREFWQRVMPPDGSPGAPVAEVLRDIRSAYAQGSPRIPTYLAYVYYGHPRLRLHLVH